MNDFHKASTVLLAALCVLPLFTGCDSSAREQQNITEEDMPYGATMREDNSTFAIPMTYDRRFLEEEQVAAAADFIYAIQTSDSAGYQEATFPFYAQYQMDEVYGLGSMDALIDRLHDKIGSSTADDYQFNMLLINDISTNTDAGELSVICDMLTEIYDGEGNFMDTVEHAWDLTVEWNIGFEENTQYAVVSDQHMFLFQTADGCFCLM